MRNYIKKKESGTVVKHLKKFFADAFCLISAQKKLAAIAVAIVILLPSMSMLIIHKNINEAELDESVIVTMADIPLAAASSKRTIITVPNGIVKANPFVPYRDITGSAVVADIPAFTLVEPPEAVNENSDAARVMDTIVSGILYDKFSPSAILNIEGNDYLVKKGDVVNNYKVVNISQDSVTVQLGKNVYKAGIGEILTEGTLNHNEVANLNNKFGGVK